MMIYLGNLGTTLPSMAAAQHHEISSSVSFIICYQRCIFGNEKSRGSADVFVQQEEEEEAEEVEEEEEEKEKEKEEKSQDPRRRMTLINPNDARKSCVTQNTGTCCCTSSPRYRSYMHACNSLCVTFQFGI